MGTSSRPGRFRRSSALAAAGLCLAAAGPAHAATVQRVTVKMSEYRFRLSTNTVHRGAVVFTIINKGEIPHDFSIQKLNKVSSFKKAGTYYYLCTVGAHVQYGMYGNLHVKR